MRDYMSELLFVTVLGLHFWCASASSASASESASASASASPGPEIPLEIPFASSASVNISADCPTSRPFGVSHGVFPLPDQVHAPLRVPSRGHPIQAFGLPGRGSNGISFANELNPSWGEIPPPVRPYPSSLDVGWGFGGSVDSEHSYPGMPVGIGATELHFSAVTSWSRMRGPSSWKVPVANCGEPKNSTVAQPNLKCWIYGGHTPMYVECLTGGMVGGTAVGTYLNKLRDPPGLSPTARRWRCAVAGRWVAGWLGCSVDAGVHCRFDSARHGRRGIRRLPAWAILR